MRPLAEIGADITATALRLAELTAERNAIIYRLFDDGASCPDIARQLDMKANNVRQLLWQSGRTKAGRRMTRAAIAEAVSHQSDPMQAAESTT